MAWGNLFFKFDGRLDRSNYWLATCILLAICLVLFGLNYLSQNPVIQSVSGMIDIVILISILAVGIRRLHDRNRSGWYLILFYVVPAVLCVIGMMLDLYSDETAPVGFGVWIIAFAISVWAFVELGWLRGSAGPNQYGPDPIAPRTH